MRLRTAFLLGSIVILALSGCGSSRSAADRAAARAAKHLDREAAKAKLARASGWGHFSGPVETRWEDDGLYMVLLNELRYTDPYGEVWTAPAGSRVNGASIPRAFWTIIGGPFEGKYRKPSVLHDVAYDDKTRSSEDADRMFYNAMRCSGVSAVTAKTMYYVLRRHGRHWKHPMQRVGGLAKTERATAIDPGELDALQSWIRQNDPNLEQIEAHASESR